MSRIALCLVAFIPIFSGALRPLLADDKPAKRAAITSLPRLSPELRDALQDRRFADAIKRIDVELSDPKVKSADYLLYLRGRAQTELKLYDQAIATFGRLEADFPKSGWVSRARFGHADVFMRQRNYQAAGEIYAREAARLLSAGRRDELAAIYLEFADRYFAGVTSEAAPGEKHPDYSQALAFYQQARSLRPSLEKEQQIDLRIARCQQELNNLRPAIDAYRQFVTTHGQDADPKKRAPVALEIEARYQLGRALLAAGEPAEARKTWRDLLDGAAFKITGNPLLAAAQFELSRTYGIPKPANDGDLELGVATLEAFLKLHPKDRRAAAAELDIAASYGARGRFEPAIARLKAMIANTSYTASDEMPKARNLLGEILFSQQKFDEAIAVWRAFLAAHPNHRATNEVLTRITDAEYAKAVAQFKSKRFNAARELWQTFLQAHPLDERAPRILNSFASMKYTEGIDRVKTRIAEAAESGKPLEPLDSTARDLFQQAVADWRRLISRFQNSPEAERAKLAIGEVLEQRLGRLSDAIEAYKQADDEGAERIKRLTERQMEVLTPRKFRSQDHPFLKLSTRNVDKVTLKVYRVEMTDYFRKMHLAGAIEKLDIALIDPDRTFDFPIKNYEKYRPFEHDVPIPVTGPGVWAVTVTSDKLEATTMLVVSDLDVIVKASRNELFVFAEDVAAQKPASGTRILISDGARIFAEETTNKEGVVQKTFEELKTVKDLRVFAVRDGHIGSTVNALEGLDFAVGLSPVGLIYTDRPAYRHGELVNIKGLIRWVAGDRLTFKESERFKLEVSDPRGRPLHSGDVRLNRFGSFATSFVLPESVPHGDCSIHVFQPGGNQSYTAQFQIHEAQLEPIRLEVELPRKVYYRGEKIEGKIRLRYYYGTPLVGREVRYRLADDRIQTGTTNAAGELAVEFPTRRFSESQTLELSAEYPERNLRTVEKVFLAARGFDIRLSTVRKVYVNGETFDVTVHVTDPAGEPVTTTLKLDVLEKTATNRVAGERLVESFELKTDAQTGTSAAPNAAKQTVRIEKAGRYVLRATAVDRFGTPVSGSHDVQISGEDDAIRLRILADRHNYQAGDTAHVTLHWREKPALALVAYEGASLLGYRLVELKTGTNRLEFAVESKLAPNFLLSVAVIDRTRFHQASSDFAVTRKLKVTLKPNRSTPKPGEPLTVDLTATDPQGNPVAAELSLAMVQRNLLDFFNAKRVLGESLFGAAERKASMRTMTSCTFLYAPKTHGLSEALLAEARREETVRRERNAIAGNDKDEGFSFVVDGNVADQFDALFRAGRYQEAESLARRLKEREPNEAASDAMIERARMARQLAKNPGHGTAGKWGMQNLYESENTQFFGDSEVSGTEIITDWSRLLARGVEFQGRGIGSGGMGGAPIGTPGPGQIVGMNSSLRSHTIRNLPQSQESPASQSIEKSKERMSGAQVFKSGGKLDGSASVRISRPSTDSLSTAPVLSYNYVTEKDFYYEQKPNGETQIASGGNRPRTGLPEATEARILSEIQLGETGYWNPSIVTGADGKASVTFRLPERSTAWKLRAIGINEQTLAGEADGDVVAKKDFFGEMKLPQVFTAGDHADVLVEIQNASLEKGTPIDLRLRMTLGDRATELRKSIVSSGPGIAEVVFPVSFGEAASAQVSAQASAEFELTLESGSRQDVARATVPVRPYGLPVFSSVSGTAGQSTIVFVDVDHKLNPEHPQLEILIGPSVDRALLDTVLGAGIGPMACDRMIITNALERAASDILGGVALRSMIGASREHETPEAQALAVRVGSAIAQLVSAQRDDGGWSWTGGAKASKSDRMLSARVVWAFAAARRAGFAVPPEPFEKATTFLSSALAAASPAERELQASLFHALAEAGKGDFVVANRLYRDRNSLSSAGRLQVALALARLDRKEMAGEMLSLVKLGANDSINMRNEFRTSASSVVWGGVELRALYLLALEEIHPTSEQVAKMADWLLAARHGSRWSPERANGPAITALARWFSRVKHVREKYTLTVYVNDRPLPKIEFDPAADSSRRIEVPAAMLVQGRPQRINFDMEGRGRFSYSAALSGFVPAERLAATTNDWSIERWYEPAQRMLNGELIPRGFDVVSGSYTSFRNELTQLPVGVRCEVTIHMYRRTLRGTLDEPLDYLVVTEPLPAGASVLANSVQGNFERYEISQGAITFYVGDVVAPGSLRYTLIGYVPGHFRTAPTVVRSFYAPQKMMVSRVKAFDVLAKGAASRDEYKLTPRELFELGKRLVAKKQFSEGAKHLTKLLKDYRLRDDAYREAVQALFQAALATGNDSAIVENFEIIKEKLPGIEIEFDSILRVGQAYRTLGEYERSFLVYRATLEADFQRESQIAGFLDDRGEFLRSVQVMERLLRDFPAEAYVATGSYALAQEIFGKAGGAADNNELRTAGLTRVDLIAASIDLFDHFVATWPNDPAADQAVFSTVSGFLALEKYESAIARSQRAVKRYPDSPLSDSFWYVIGFSDYALGRNDEALETCRRVAEMTRKDPHTGTMQPAENKWQAIYITGQIFHSLGKPAQAIGEYERVKDRFADAREAIDYFMRRRLTLPEVITVRPNEPAKITLGFRNIARVDLKVYRVDLLKFGLLKRNLAKITAINLAGIRPYYEKSLELGDGKDYRDREKPLTLPLKDEGAYLLVCRGDDDYASGLVLVSPLELAVQEDSTSGRVRVTAKDAVGDRYLRKVLVKVIGSGNPDFVSGETDLRGIFTADAIRGTTTVIARADSSRYAFFRGSTPLGAVPVQAAPSSQSESEAVVPNAPAFGKTLLENVIRSNSAIQQQQRDSYRSLLRNKKQGVQAKEAF